MKWIVEVEKKELEEDMQRISEIVEGLFLMLHKKIVLNKLQLSNRDGQSEGYLYEFMEFFKIDKHIQDTRGKGMIQQHAYDDDNELGRMSPYEEECYDNHQLFVK